MWDLVMAMLILLLFVIAWAFVHGCGALTEPSTRVQREEEVEP